jgi:hypothetical protein
VFMGGDNGFLSLVTQPDIKSYGDLKGKTLSVDALTTGYAFWSAGGAFRRASMPAPC